MPFHFERLEIPDVVLVTPKRYEDARGHFEETFRESAFAEAGIDVSFVQDNLARSGKGVLRGLHFQAPPTPQGKLVGVTNGTIFDVAVDLRVGSPTFGRWVGRTLDDEAGRLLWVPEGFAHGYVVLSDSAHVSYRVTAEYAPDLDGGVRWDDPTLAVEWPISDPILSERDRALPLMEDFRSPFAA